VTPDELTLDSPPALRPPAGSPYLDAGDWWGRLRRAGAAGFGGVLVVRDDYGLGHVMNGRRWRIHTFVRDVGWRVEIFDRDRRRWQHDLDDEQLLWLYTIADRRRRAEAAR